MKINSKYRNGILQLACLLGFTLLLIFLNGFLPNHQPQFKLDNETQTLIDTQRLVLKQQQKFTKTYYVNNLNDYTAYQLGLSTLQIDRLLAYRKSGKLIYSMDDFKKVTLIDTIQFKKIKKQLRFPKSASNTQIVSQKTTKANSKKHKRFDLNQISEIELKQEFKFPDFVAKRIIKFRKYLNGYRVMNQIEDVYGILPYQVNQIKKHCFLKNPSKEKKKIHELSQKELSNVPYLSWNTSKQIIKYVKNNGKLTSFEILHKIDGLSTKKINRLPLYLTLN